MMSHSNCKVQGKREPAKGKNEKKINYKWSVSNGINYNKQ